MTSASGDTSMPPTMPLDSSASAAANPPAPGLIQTLQDIRKRVKVFSVAYGAGIVVAAAAGLLLAALGVFVYALVTWVVRPLTARLSIGDVAGRVEHAFPQFDDRLRSTVD